MEVENNVRSARYFLLFEFISGGTTIVQGSSGKAGKDRLIAAPFRAVFSGPTVLHQGLLSDQLTALSHDELTLLSRMQETKSREEHAQKMALNSLSLLTLGVPHKDSGTKDHKKISQKLIDGLFIKICARLMRSNIRKQLEMIDRLQALGLILNEDLLLERIMLFGDRDEWTQNETGYFGILTSDRPAMLARSLSAFSELLRQYRPDCHLIIIDDSKNLHARKENYAHVERLSRAYIHVKPTYIDERGRVRLAEELSKRSGVALETLRFALASQSDHRTVGSSRNVAHLVATNTIAMFSDDDTCPRYVTRSGNSPYSPLISGSRPLYETEFYADRQTWGTGVSYDEEFDVFDLHEQVLGKSLMALHRSGKHLSIGSCDENLLTSLIGRDCKIGISTGGISGDTGMWSSAGFVLGAGAASPPFSACDESYYERIKTSRYVLHLPRQLQITHFPQLQTMSYGIDLRHVHGPFFPFGRNTDGAFVALLQKTQPQVLIAHLPVAIWHEPDAVRQYVLEPIEALLTMRMTDWVILLIGSMSLPRNTPSREALMLLGWQLKAALMSNSRSFEAILRSLVLQQRTANILQAKKMLDEHHGPKTWESDLTHIVFRLTNERVTTESLVPYELRSMSVDAAFTFMRDALMRYADLLCQWPAIVDAARDITDKDMSLL